MAHTPGPRKVMVEGGMTKPRAVGGDHSRRLKGKYIVVTGGRR
jgi:hypothetical protein